MADRNVQPTSTSAPDVASSIPNKESKDEPQYQQTPADSSQDDTSQVRNAVLEAIANHQKKRISELERNLEKKRATIQRLSATPTIPHPAFPIVPPNAMPAMPAMPAIPTSAPIPSASAPPKSPPLNPTPSSEGAPTKPPPSSHSAPPSSQPQPAASTAASNPILAAPMLGFHPQAQPPPYPYIFPPPDPTFAAQYMGVMPPALLHAAQASHAQPPGQAHPQDKANDGQEQKQSRYWTPEEHERFLAGMKACGPKNYMQISEYVGTRNPKQVRTHAQKYQKRLEREDAKRRRDTRHGRVNSSSPMTSVAADAAAAVKAAAAVAMRGNVPGISSTPGKDTDSTGTPAGPSSSSSGKQCNSLHPHSMGASSGGSISANTASERHAETSGTNHHSAAVAAIAAEAKALGRGVLPPGAIKISSHAFENQPRPTMVNKNTGNLEDEKPLKSSRETSVPEQAVKQDISGNAAPPVATCIDIQESKKDGDRGPEASTVSGTNGNEHPTDGDSTKDKEQQECTEAIEATSSDQGGGEHKVDRGDVSHSKKAKDTQIKRAVNDDSELCKDEQQLSNGVEFGKRQHERAPCGSVVHTRLTKTIARRESTEIGASGTVDVGKTVKHEPECVDSCTNLTDGREPTAQSNAAAGENDGGIGKTRVSSSGLVGGVGAEKTDGGVKQELHMSVVVDTELNSAARNESVYEADRESGDGGKRKVSGDAHGQSVGAGAEGGNEEGLGECATREQASTAGSKREKSGGESRKRARDERATAGNKRAKKDDGCGAEGIERS
ncbi:Myb-like DNA-binding protein [Gracilaria domingensis]|nr:Myb-like DNA-binding protein [Gracilaria domingensis]